jgi:hypothetical protein
LPAGCAYDDWREMHVPALERWFHVMDAEQLAWDDYEERCKAAVKARELGAEVPDQAPPSPESSVFACLRMCAPISADRRAEIVRESGTRRRPMPGPTASMPDMIMWIIGEARVGGIACDFDTAYQAWFVFADLLLRDVDIGAIIARVHPKSVEYRSPRLSDAKLDDLNARLASAERKRVNKKRNAFGYRTP